MPRSDDTDDRAEALGASTECLKLCHELSFYTLSLHDDFFLHQIAVGAYAAQHPTESSKTVCIAFSLIGLFLFCERKYTGREVQLAHMKLAQKSKRWPHFHPPKDRGSLTVADVLKAEPAAKRDALIKEWAASIWMAWQRVRPDLTSMIQMLDA